MNISVPMMILYLFWSVVVVALFFSPDVRSQIMKRLKGPKNDAISREIDRLRRSAPPEAKEAGKTRGGESDDPLA